MADDPFQTLAAFLEEERTRVVRLWSKRLRVELQELEVAGKDLRAPLDAQISELIRLLKARGEESLRLWPESVRAHGALRYSQRFDADDLVREYRILHVLLLRLYARRNEGAVPIEICEVVAELIGEAIAAVEASYARALRTEEVRFREAGVMESILHNVEVGILLGELDGSISYATPAVARLLGVPVRALIGGGSTHALAMVLAQVNARHQDGKPFRAADLPFLRALRESRAVRGV
ncbi:MAG: hybrid sensor histidine kinase/response regulator, partial [Myxococcaceae bacterium]